MVAYSKYEYSNLSPTSIHAIDAAQGERKPWTGEQARSHMKKQRKCPLTPNVTAIILQSLSIPTNTNIHLAAGVFNGTRRADFSYKNVFTKNTLMSGEDYKNMHCNTKAASDYYASINNDSYLATYFGNMEKMVAAMRAFKGSYKTDFLSRKSVVVLTFQG